uniref:WS_DGAT_C domain-containing protein n=1 Tax=Angiostrongylus cantonensis TaxID=6313 RepID=A0A0K0D6J1_ANGCA
MKLKKLIINKRNYGRVRNTPTYFYFAKKWSGYISYRALHIEQILSVIQANGSLEKMVKRKIFTAITPFPVDAFISPPCNDEQEQISRLGYYWKRPVFARALVTPFAMNPTIFPNTVNVATASSAGLSHALIQFVRVINEAQVTLVGPKPISGDHYTITNSINDYLNATGSLLVKKNIEITQFVMKSELLAREKAPNTFPDEEPV